ncbi:MAG: hypothetical protein R3F45_16145 [Gammaproteobacteria bacterium]
MTESLDAAAESLAHETTQWLAELPPNVRPQRVANAYPRIANTLCRNWQDPMEWLGYIDSLLLDSRGGRHGFSADIAMELARLKDYYETIVHPTPQTCWDRISG